MSWQGLAWPGGLIVTHPLLTALPWHLGPPGTPTPETWRPLPEAQWCAAHCTIHARAVVLAAGLKSLPIAVADPVQEATHADHL